MTIRRSHPPQGIALIIVMLLMMALLVIAGVFAHSIKVETKLTNNSRSESDLEWLGRSGVEMARWILAEQKRLPSSSRWDSLDQFWAGGPGPVDDPDYEFAGMSLQNIPMGPGRVTLQIIDQERKININNVDERIMDRAIAQVSADATDAAVIFNSIADWRDRDDNPRVGGGTESDFYLSLDPPYFAKNGPIDDITELLKIRGVTPATFWGPHTWEVSDRPPGLPDSYDSGPPPTGLVDLFCAVSNGQVNVNTASATVLHVIAGIDPVLAQQIVERRGGADHQDGTPDDEPFRDLGTVTAMMGAQGAAAAGAGVPSGPGGPSVPGGPAGVGRLTVQSTTFEVRVDAIIGTAHRRFVALVRRVNPRDPVILYFRRD